MSNNTSTSSVQDNNSFTSYLIHQKKFSKRTVYEYEKALEKYLKWCDREGNNPKEANHTIIMEYVAFLQRKITSNSIKNHLSALKNWYSFQLKQKLISSNPVTDVKILGTPKKISTHLLSKEELSTMYDEFLSYQPKVTKPSTKRTHQQDIVLLGLMIYQAITATELQQLLKQDIDLTKGTITIRQTVKTNERILDLEGKQILPLINWLKTEKGENVFQQNINHLSTELFKRLQRLDYHVNQQLIRKSVIINWLKHYNIVEVKYKGGFRHLSSVDNYKQQLIDDLQKGVMKYHPLS